VAIEGGEALTGFVSDPQIVDVNGAKFEMVVTGEIEHVRGPLGRFLDLAAQITAEGLQVPTELVAVMGLLERPEPQAWAELVEGYRQMAGKVARVAALATKAHDADYLLQPKHVFEALDEPEG